MLSAYNQYASPSYLPKMARQQATYLPADLYSRVHDHVWLVVGLALGLALVLPKLLLGQYTQLCCVNSMASSFIPLYLLTMMASEDPMVEVPIVFASGSAGALNSLAIIDTHPVHNSANIPQPLCSVCTNDSGYRR